jgi:hypothetical protein
MMKFTQLPFFQHLNWRPDRAELRRFAVAMLIGFAVLGMLAAWRAGGLGRNALALWLIGVALAVGALVPGLGRFVYLLVYLPTSIIGYVVSSIVLTLIFYFVFTPLGLLLKLLGHDLLQLNAKRAQSNWRQRGDEKHADRYYHQF